MTRPSAKARAIAEAMHPWPEGWPVPNAVVRDREEHAALIDAHLADVRSALMDGRDLAETYDAYGTHTACVVALAALTPEATP